MLNFSRKTIAFGLFLMILVPFTMIGQQNKGVVKIKTNANINQLITQKINYNKSLTTIKGFKIQLFFGSEKNAYEIKDKFEAFYPQYKANIVFSSPQWKVQVGGYRTRLEADRDLLEIKKEYPGAIIVTTEIDLN